MFSPFLASSLLKCFHSPYMCYTGIIMGEFLVSKEGIGYLIMYGSQVFNLDLVMSGVIILGVVATVMYYAVNFVEKKLLKNKY